MPDGSNDTQNIVINGDFEIPKVTDYYHYACYSADQINGWTMEWVSQNRDGSACVELQRNEEGVPPLTEWAVGYWKAAKGYQWAELDSDPPVRIYQDLPTIPGEIYNLSFAFSSRPAESDNLLEVKWANSTIDVLSADGSNKTNTDWRYYTYNVTAVDSITRLEFADLSNPDGLGTFIDDVKVTSLTHASEKIEPTIEITSIIPKEGTMLTAGQTVDFTINVDYDLGNNDYGTILLSIDKFTAAGIVKEFQVNQGDPKKGSYAFTISNAIGDDWNKCYVSITLYAALKDKPLPASYSAFDYKEFATSKTNQAPITISGHWKGKLYQFGPTYLWRTYQYSLNLSQNGSQIIGTSKIEYGNYYAVIEISGSISEGVVSYAGTSFLEKNEPPSDWYFILEKADLSIVNTTPLVLEGPWVCTNGGAWPGSIFLIKQ